MNWFEENYLIPLIIAILIAAIIFYLSSIPASGFPSGLGVKTKIYHFIVFASLAFFLSISMVGRNKENHSIYLTIIISIFYAMTDELHQLFVPGRNPAVTDILIDSVGVIAGSLVYAIILKFKPIKQHQTIF